MKEIYELEVVITNSYHEFLSSIQFPVSSINL